jgi:uncharacterized protein (DUF433 family)
MGKPAYVECVLRYALVLNLTANGMNKTEILEHYPALESEDIDQCLQYAAYLAEEELYTTQKVS